MSKLNINRNIFLEKEELERFQSFLINDTVNEIMLDNTSKWGIVRTVFEGISPDFLIEVGSNIGTIKLAVPSKAVDKDKLLIKSKAFDNLSVPSDGILRWVKISHQYSGIEEGSCTINENGEVSGVNTLFTQVIRGQNTEVPTKIKFVKNGLINNQVYEVVSITDNLNILLSGFGFAAESGLQYIVIGSTPVGETITSSQLEGLYKYDFCKIDLVTEESLDTPPITNYVEDKQFYIARVVNNGGTVTVEDKREEQFLTFNVEGVNDKLDKKENLADLEDASIARTNLGNVLTYDEIIQLFFTDSGWQSMTRGSAVETTLFSLKIRRLGQLVFVTGRLRTRDGAQVNEKIASIPYSSLGGGVVAGPTATIYFEANEIGGGETNRGIKGYIPAFTTQANLEFLILDSYQTTDVVINFSYIAK